jgi:ssDNA-binding replication factor A large subunit
MKGSCPVHGKVKGEDALGLKAVFDDGTGSAILKCEGGLVEKLLGKELASISGEIKESLDPDSVLGDLTRKLLCRQWTVIGDPMIDDYGLTIAVREMLPGWEKDEIGAEIGSLMEVIV